MIDLRGWQNRTDKVFVDISVVLKMISHFRREILQAFGKDEIEDHWSVAKCISTLKGSIEVRLVLGCPDRMCLRDPSRQHRIHQSLDHFQTVLEAIHVTNTGQTVNAPRTCKDTR